MAFDVFISYSSKNSVIANAACAAIEATGAHCWMAPRNIRPGRTYGEAIIDGMNECKILVLIYSTYSNASPQVLREVERAVSKGLEIITVRVEDVVMSKAMEYFLAASHWLDGISADTESALHRLGDAVHLGLNQPDALGEFSAPAAAVQAVIPHKLPAHNLPASLTSFVGRATEKTDIGEVLVQSRLVTITGPGGSGKTRVALEVAGEQLDHYPDGVWFVDLQSVSADDAQPGIAAAVLAALKLSEQPDVDPMSTIRDDLRAKSSLLVFDNCEQVVDAARDFISTLLRDCAHVKVLATSRAALGAAGETVWPLAPFGALDPEKLPRGGQALVNAASANDAVRLFVDRARAISPAFALTEQNAHAVAQICSRLDGIPLAIELAAARVKVLSPDQIAARLDDQFRLLGGNKGAPVRQQTLRATLDWSYDLLSETEQVMLQRLSVFAGPCSMEAVETVCAGDPIDDWDILDLLTQLVDKSLVLADEWEGGYRYRLLQSVREYAAEKDLTLAPSSREELRNKHRDWYLQAVEAAEPNLWGGYQAAWLERLDADRPNWLAALAWSIEQGDSVEAVRLAAAVGRFWMLRGYFTEAGAWLERVLASASKDSEPAAYAKVLNASGSIAWSRGDVDKAKAWFEESLAIYRQLGDDQRTADLLNNLGNIALDSGDEDGARTLLEEALASYRSMQDQPGISAALGNLALIALRGGDLEKAKGLYEESLLIDRALDDSWGIATSLHGLGLIGLRSGSLDTARAHLDDSLTRRVELDDQAGIAECLEALGELALSKSEPDRALRLWAAASILRETVGAVMPAADGAAIDARLAEATDAVGPVARKQCWDEGRQWSTEEAVRYGRG
jgi:predicted ATPase